MHTLTPQHTHAQTHAHTHTRTHTYIHTQNTHTTHNHLLRVSLNQAKPTTPAGAPWEAECWEVGLAEPLAAAGTTTVESFVVYAEVQKPFPAEVEQGQPQLMLFVDNAYVLSPYQVSQQSTEVRGRVEVSGGVKG